MKKVMIALSLLIMQYTAVQACDICGATLSGSGMGLLQQSNQNYLGLSYQLGSYSRLGSANGLYYDITERYQNIELTGRFALTKRLFVLAQLPLTYDKLTSEEGDRTRQGLGDAKLTVQANLWRNYRETDKKWKSDLWLNTTVKLPTGDYTAEGSGTTGEHFTFLKGTGSWDAAVALNYTLQYKKWGFSTEGSYLATTENADEYKFGNRWAANSRLFYMATVKNTRVVPFVGASFEKSKGVRYLGFVFDDTVGKASMLEVGGQVFMEKMMLSASFSQPISDGNQILESSIGQRFVARANFFF